MIISHTRWVPLVRLATPNCSKLTVPVTPPSSAAGFGQARAGGASGAQPGGAGAGWWGRARQSDARADAGEPGDVQPESAQSCTP